MIMEYLGIPHSDWVRHSVSYESIIWTDQPRCTKDEWENAKSELQAAEPLRQLRIQRNQLLASTDWRMNTDYPYNDQAQWASYRTALRNLPETATPTLDENGNLIVDWPQSPDNV
jgi:hypothetical protein